MANKIEYTNEQIDDLFAKNTKAKAITILFDSGMDVKTIYNKIKFKHVNQYQHVYNTISKYKQKKEIDDLRKQIEDLKKK